MEAGRDRAMSSGSRGMLEAFGGRGRLDGKGCSIGEEEAALGDEHPRQAAAKVEPSVGAWCQRSLVGEDSGLGYFWVTLLAAYLGGL
jgi:hypothetical protein